MTFTGKTSGRYARLHAQEKTQILKNLNLVIFSPSCDVKPVCLTFFSGARINMLGRMSELLFSKPQGTKKLTQV